jgi:hypothetical protein
MNQSQRYLDETLFQAKRAGLQTHYIQQLEVERNFRLETERKMNQREYR